MVLTKAYIINLKRRKDRLQHITEQCRKHNLEMTWIEAVDGNIVYKNEPRKRLRGILGCYHSHLNLLKKFNGLEDDYFFIGEDDVIFEDNFKEKLDEYSKQLPDNWDILYLGGNIKTKGSVLNFSANLKKALNVFCTHAYIVRKKAIPSLIQTIERKKWKVDVLYTKFQKSNNCFITIPELAWQKEGFSDIELKITNNTFLKNLHEQAR